MTDAEDKRRKTMAFMDEKRKAATHPITVLREAVEALKPFADAVYNDNGDVTLSIADLRPEHYLRAVKARALLIATLKAMEAQNE